MAVVTRWISREVLPESWRTLIVNSIARNVFWQLRITVGVRRVPAIKVWPQGFDGGTFRAENGFSWTHEILNSHAGRTQQV